MKVAQLETIIAPVVTGLGYELWGIEYLPQGKHSLLRIYIDAEPGITLDDCEVVSRQLSAVFDVEEPIRGHYSLEVSSPGLDRPLFTAAQYQRYLGQAVQCRMRRPHEGRRNFKGTLQAVDADTIVVALDDGEAVTLALADIDKGHLV